MTTTYQLEGHGLEIFLAYRRVESIRFTGNNLKVLASKLRELHRLQESKTGQETDEQLKGLEANEATLQASINRNLLPSLNAVIKRQSNNIEIGTPVSKFFPGDGELEGQRYAGTVTHMNLERLDPDTNTVEVFCKVKYEDGDVEDLLPSEVTELYTAHCDRMYVKIVDLLIPAFGYLESRITGTCQPIYSCASTYELFRCVVRYYAHSGGVIVLMVVLVCACVRS